MLQYLIIHAELLPTQLLFIIAASRTPFLFHLLLKSLLWKFLLNSFAEAGSKVPTPFGSTIGIIGTLVLGESAVSANLVSPILIIIVAITGICSFTIPDFSLSFSF